ncbi:MAG: hypothetical protein IPO81_02460 [Kouleothrix sp.]|nr:hypothetical protein [Kouleothrix sp.]
MSEIARMWVEISFNIVYLVVVWWLVAVMVRRRSAVAPSAWPVAARVIAAFALLALGDTGHVGFRVLAYALGGLDAQPLVLGVPISLVGLGALATAFTLTLFYVLMLDIWRLRFGKALGWFGVLLLAAAVARLVVMAFPANRWDQVVPPQPWSLYRNLPLIVQGLGVAWLILRDARADRDRTFGWIGAMILVSYACYIPVVLLVQRAPMIGMLMIPKTIAYVAVAALAYRGLYRRAAPSMRAAIAS